jgi:autotransporter-associated beta strand protein
MKLSDSSAAKVGASNVSAIASITSAAKYNFHVYTSFILSKIISGAVGLVKSGLGTLTFGANNTYTGATTINEGTLKLVGGVGVGSSVTVNSGGTLDINGYGVGADLFLGTGTVTNTSASPVQIALPPSINQSQTNSFAGNLLFLITQGGGPTLLNPAQTFTGGIWVANSAFLFYGIGDGGVIQLGNVNVQSQIQYLGSSNISTNRIISIYGTMGTGTRVYVYNNGTGTITFTGGMYTESPTAVAQTIELSGANTGDNYESGVIKNSGVGASASNVLSIEKTGTGKWILSGNNTYTGTTILTLGTLGFAHSSGFGIGGNIIFKGGTLQYNGVSTDLSSRIKSSTSAIIIDTNGQSVTFATPLPATNVGGLTKLGTGALTIPVGNLYTGATTVSGGALATGGSQAIPDSSAVTVSNGAILLLGGNETVGSISGAGTCSINGYVFTVGGDNSTTLFSGNITGTNGQLVKNGTGVLTLSGSNTYTGNTTVNSGVIVFQSKSATSASAITTVGTGGVGLGIGAGANDWAISDIVTLFNTGSVGSLTVSTAANIAVDSTSGNIAISDVFSSGRSLLKVGTNTLTLSGTNTYTGATIILVGTLATSAANKLPDTSAVSISSGATLSLGGNDTVGSIAGAGSISLGANTLTVGGDNSSTTASGVISGTGSLFKTGTGVLTLSAANTFTGTLTINNGTVKMGNASARGAGSTVLSNTGILDLNGNGWSSIPTAFSNSATSKIINTSAGTVNLNFNAGVTPTINAQIDDSSGGAINLDIGGTGASPTFTNTNNKIRGPINWIPNGGCSVANLNAGAFGTGDIPIANGGNIPTINLTGADNSTDTSRSLRILGSAGAGGQLQVSGAGTLTFGGAYSATTGAKVLILRGTNTGNNTIAGIIYDGTAGSISVIKRESGKWILSASNTYTGATTIQGGTLQVSKTVGGITGTASFTTTSLTVDFGGVTPTTGSAYKFFPGSTSPTNLTVTLTNAGGKTGTYNYTNSTLTIN